VYIQKAINHIHRKKLLQIQTLKCSHSDKDSKTLCPNRCPVILCENLMPIETSCIPAGKSTLIYQTWYPYGHVRQLRLLAHKTSEKIKKLWHRYCWMRSCILLTSRMKKPFNECTWNSQRISWWSGSNSLPSVSPVAELL